MRLPVVRLLGIVAVALVATALLPSTAYAWTPGTHLFLGEAVMRSLAALPAATARTPSSRAPGSRTVSASGAGVVEAARAPSRARAAGLE